MSEFFKLYDAIISSVDNDCFVDRLYSGSRWTMAECCENLGIAMTTECQSIAPMYTNNGKRISLGKFAHAIKSWNFNEASLSLAACNAFFNSAERMKVLCAYEPYENYCTSGLELSGAKIGLVGHLTVTDEMQKKADKIFILEKSPKAGDYPDSACDYILPQCDIVIITGSAIINKTLPHLLELCKNASSTILVGPSVPMCPELLNFGIDRLSGMIVSNKNAMESHVFSGDYGSPYPNGTTFLLKK